MMSKSLTLNIASLKRGNNHSEGIHLEPDVFTCLISTLLMPRHLSRAYTEEGRWISI